MTGWLIVAVFLVGAFAFRWVTSDLTDELDDENCELREQNVELALRLAFTDAELRRVRDESDVACVDAYMTGWMEGAAAEKEQRS